ncbi:MAG: pyridoxal-phosphate dependent enzyme [Deltaproteobacteria bacterium]
MSFISTSFGTPLVRLQRFAPGTALFAKVEMMLPSGSAYDRIAGPLLAACDDDRVVVAASGSPALAFAAAAAPLKKKLTVVVPAKTLPEHLDLLARYAVEVVRVPGELEKTHAVASTIEGTLLVSPKKPELARAAFSSSLGAELVDMLDDDGEKTVLVSPLNGGELLFGVADAFVAAGRPVETVGTVRCEQAEVSVQDGVVRGSSAPQGATRVVCVLDPEAYETRIELARKEGILVGMGSAAAARVARDEASEGARVISIVVDAGDRYFSVDRKFGGSREHHGNHGSNSDAPQEVHGGA